MNKIYLVSFLILLTGCAIASSSGVVKVGEDTLTISGSGKSPGGYAGSEVMKAVNSEANDYCAGMDKKVLVITTHMNDQSFGIPAAAEIQFKCLNANDPEMNSHKAKEVKQDSPTATPSKASTTDKLKELATMRQQGLINDSEYAIKKKAILDAM